MNTPQQGVRRCVPSYVHLTTGLALLLAPVTEAPGALSPREYAAWHGILVAWSDLSLLRNGRR